MLKRVRTFFRQRLCALTGHDMLKHYGKDRLSLRCNACGRETPGWELTETPPTPSRAPLVLVSRSKKIA